MSAAVETGHAHVAREGNDNLLVGAVPEVVGDNLLLVAPDAVVVDAALLDPAEVPCWRGRSRRGRQRAVLAIEGRRSSDRQVMTNSPDEVTMLFSSSPRPVLKRAGVNSTRPCM